MFKKITVNYIENNASIFRKKNPSFMEHTEQVGNRNLSVFMDASYLDTFTSIPEDVKILALQDAYKNGMSRIEGISSDTRFDIRNDFLYYLGLQSCTYDVYSQSGQLLYSVIKITGMRYRSYEKTIYGGAGALYEYIVRNWRTSIHTNIIDLCAQEEKYVIRRYGRNLKLF